MKQPNKFLLVGVLAGVFALPVFASNALALSMLRLTEGSEQVTVTDNDTSDGSSTLGNVVYIGSIGNFNLNIASGISKPILGSASVPMLDLSFQNNSTGAGTLVMEYSVDGFTGFPPSISGFRGFVDGNSFSNSTTIQYELLMSTANETFSGTLIGDTGLLTANGGASGNGFSGMFNALGLTTDSPYALTARITLTHTAGGITSGDAGMDPVPEPTSMLLFGTGLAGMAMWRFRSSSSGKTNE